MDLLFYPVMVGAILLPAWWFYRRGYEVLEALALGAGTGILSWGALGFVRFVLLLPDGAPRRAGLAASAACLVLAVCLALIARTRTLGNGAHRPGRWHPLSSGLLLAMAGSALLTLGIEASLPHFDLAERYYDWFLHYDVARIYTTATDLGHRWGGAGVPTRTPLYNLVGAVAMSAFGTRFTILQVLTAAVGWLWLLPFALIARRLLPSGAVVLTSLAGISPLVLTTHSYVSSKGMVTFFALLALERFLALREGPRNQSFSVSIQFGVFSAATVMTHNGFVGFPLALFGLYAWQVVRRPRLDGRGFMIAAASGLLVIVPWLAWAIVQYGPHTALFSYPQVPFPSVFRWAFDRLLILVTSVWPIALPLDRYLVNPIATYFAAYTMTASGLLGLVYLLRASAQNLKRATRIRLGPAEWPLLCFAIVGMLIADVFVVGTVINNANGLFIPGLLALLILAVRANPLSRFFVVVALVESTVFEAAVLVWVWSSAGTGGINDRLAQVNHIGFLGHDTLPVGLILVVAGLVLAATCIWMQLRRDPAVSGQATREQVTAA